MHRLPTDAVTGFSILGQLPGFVAGLVSSAAIAVPLYLKQKRESAGSERRIILAIQQQQQQDAGVGPMIASTMSALSGQHEALLAQFEALRGQFEKAVKASEYDRALPLARPYSAVARAVANEKAIRQLENRPDGLELSEDKLRQIHTSLFPSGYELAGQLRGSPVWLGVPGSTPDSATFVPPDPTLIPSQLSELIRAWNKRLKSLRQATEEDRLHAVADFHHKLVSIHPFLDGNGILARLLSAQQLRELLGTDVTLVERDPEYIDALRSADGGELTKLVRYFEHSIAKRVI